MGELVFVGMGLHNERDVSLRGLDEAKTADSIFVELYTSLMPNLDLDKLANLVGRELVPVSRRMLEEENGRAIIEAAMRGKVIFFAPGDPLVATTHVDLRMRAVRAGVRTRIVHSASIISAAIGLSGLQNYKFGGSVTIPFPCNCSASVTPLNVIRRNRESGLHTLCFLDLDAEKKQYLTINEALRAMLEAASGRCDDVITEDRLVVGIARAGAADPVVRAGSVGQIIIHDFGDPPHVLIFPGRLHFVEAEALIVLAQAPESVRKMVE